MLAFTIIQIILFPIIFLEKAQLRVQMTRKIGTAGQETSLRRLQTASTQQARIYSFGQMTLFLVQGQTLLSIH
jgi:hypothetical protein